MQRLSACSWQPRRRFRQACLSVCVGARARVRVCVGVCVRVARCGVAAAERRTVLSSISISFAQRYSHRQTDTHTHIHRHARSHTHAMYIYIYYINTMVSFRFLSPFPYPLAKLATDLAKRHSFPDSCINQRLQINSRGPGGTILMLIVT